MIVELDEISYSNLLKILEEKYYSTTDISELQNINQIYKALKFKSETWLSAIQPDQNFHNSKNQPERR